MRVSGVAVPCLDLKKLRGTKGDGRCWQVLLLVFSQGFWKSHWRRGGEGQTQKTELVLKLSYVSH